MKVFIIKKGTPESRFLYRAGIDRQKLEVNKLKGRGRYRGGYGKTAVEWRLTDPEEIEKLCNVVLDILSKRKDSLNPTEEKSLRRVKRTLKAIQNGAQNEREQAEKLKQKGQCILRLFEKIYPTLDPKELGGIVIHLANKKAASIADIELGLNQQLDNKIEAVREARADYLAVMRESLE